MSARIRLQRRGGKPEGVNLCASRINRADERPARHVDLEAACAFNLWNQVNVRQRRRIAKAKITPALICGQQGLEGIETSRDPGRTPTIDGRIVRTEFTAQRFQNTNVAPLLDIQVEGN